MIEARIFLMLGAILGGLAVASGAFASHALSARLTERAVEIFETASRYQMYHALALLAVGLWLSRVDEGRSLLVTAGVSYLLGILLFSGSLYALSLSGVKGLGAITPLGGLAFLVGWGCLAIAALSFK
jgi:uncharacterized membrane protein YgdD (TMEM256/DUF423 family)